MSLTVAFNHTALSTVLEYRQENRFRMQATLEAVNHEWLRYKFEIRVEHHTFGFRIYCRSNAVKERHTQYEETSLRRNVKHVEYPDAIFKHLQ